MGELNRILVESGAFNELEKPVILASGKLGIYYINTEKVLGDNGEFKKYKDDIFGMANHCDELLKHNKDYSYVVDCLADKVIKNHVIAGGQTRDWIFSVPVSKKLASSHYWIFKNGHKQFGYFNEKVNLTNPSEIRGRHVFHIADLATSGSSTYDHNSNSGWVPTIRAAGGKISKSLVVVNRNQDAREKLSAANVELEELVLIDKRFLKNVSKDINRSLAYFQDPEEWSKNYIKNNSITHLAKFFDPNSESRVRAIRFLQNYEKELNGSKWNELNKQVQELYKTQLEEFK